MSEVGPTARWVRAAERVFDAAFGIAGNPLRQLGALTFWMLWIVVASGFWIYALYETSVAGAYASVQAMTEQQPFSAGLMRSLHRYASDAFVALSVLHLLREAMLGRYKLFRWFTWVSGVPLLALAVASGIVGYWMVWDQRAQYIGVAVFEWAAWLPGFGAELVRNFIEPSAITDRFFSLLSFTHIGLPLLLLLGAWAHLLRLLRPHTQPTRALAVTSLAVLAALSLAWPARSMAVADLARLPLTVELDWFYLALLPLADLAPGSSWIAALALTALLLMLPWTTRARPPPAAVVDPEHCNGCTLCQVDCPYGAVTMVPHPDPRRHGRMAQVSTDQCAGCGVCVGACPSATPFRRGAPFATGIDLPQLPLAALRERLDSTLDDLAASAADQPRLIVLGCECAATPDAAPGTATLAAPCAALWPPVFAEYALRGGADGVLFTGCPPQDCCYRLGARWTEARLAGERAPRLRTQVPRERVHLHWALSEDKPGLQRAIDNFRAALARIPSKNSP
jgi:ferredoxin/coenzyme F420-reducing hydrogenase delta subunit